jgi:hypothetical protein
MRYINEHRSPAKREERREKREERREKREERREKREFS